MITMIRRFEIITTSTRPRTTSITVASDRLDAIGRLLQSVPAACTAQVTCCTALTSPSAAASRWLSSSQNCQT